MSSNLLLNEEINYSALYGKLFSGLLKQYGAYYISEIEDAIQNSFLKSLTAWRYNEVPDNKENWLFIVARNDVLNQIKKQNKNLTFWEEQLDDPSSMNNEKDLRLQTILFVSAMKNISKQAKIIFILKNIFGLSIAEISSNTLLNQEAIYKNINRTKRNMQLAYNGNAFDINIIAIKQKTISIVEDILYAVFNIGFDSFRDKMENMVNIELCLEAFALTKLLSSEYQADSTRNLLALFCFHTSRIPAKVDNGKFLSFFNQNRSKWNKELIQLGFHYLQKTKELHKFYIEAIIISKYMSVQVLTPTDWAAIVHLYEILQKVAPSPIATLNYCFCLSKIGETEKALTILSEIEKELPNQHIYFLLVKAEIMKVRNPKRSAILAVLVMQKMNQKIRKEHMLENGLIPL